MSSTNPVQPIRKGRERFSFGATMHVLIDRPIRVAFSTAHLLLEDFGDITDPAFTKHENGLLGVASPNMVVLQFGLHTGTVRLRVVEVASEPPLDPYWEEVVEASWTVPKEPKLWLCEDCLQGPSTPLPISFGTYRLRFCAKDFAVAEHWVADGYPNGDLDTYGGPLEEYELLLWPAPPAPDKVIKVTRSRANSRHEEAQSGQLR